MGGKGGGGGGGNVQITIPPEVLAIANRLASLSEKQFAIGEPVFRESADVAVDLLTTGGSGATTPAIQNLVQAQSAQASQQLGETQENLARAGVSGSIASDILAQQELAGRQKVAEAGPSVALPAILDLVSKSSSGTAQGLQGLQGAAANLVGGSFATQSGGGGKGKK
jgi:hypothetical protein